MMRNKSIFFTAILIFLFHFTAFAQEEEQTKIYDVSFLRSFISIEDYSEPVTSVCEEYSFDGVADDLIVCLDELTSVNSGIELLSADKLKVSGTRQDHDIVQKCLDSIKAFMSRKVLITAWLVKVDNSVLNNVKAKSQAKTAPNVLTSDQVGLLVENSSATNIFEFGLQHMQKGRSKSAKKISYTRDYNIEIAAGSAALRAISAETGDSIGLTVAPYINMAGDGVRIDVVFRRTRLEGEMEQFENAAWIKKFFDGTSGPEEPDIEAGKLQLPTIDSLQFSTSVIIPPGAVVVVSEFNSNERDGTEKWLLLMKADIQDRHSQAYGILPVLEANGGRDTRLYDLSAIFQPFTYYKKRHQSVGDFEGTDFLDTYYEHSCLSDTIETKFQYFSDFHEEARKDILLKRVNSGFVCYSARDEELQAEFNRDVINVQNDILRAITVDASFCRIPATAYTDNILALEQSLRADAVLKMISKDPELVISCGSITGMNGQVFGGNRTLRKDYVKDHNVELASGISAYDPVIGNIYRGIDMQVCPVITDKRKISLIINAIHSDFNDDLKVFEISDGGVRYQQPEVTEYAFETNLILEDNIYEYLAYPAQDDEGDYIILLLKAVIAL